MKLLVATMAFAGVAFFAPLGTWCADCGSSAAHDEGGQTEITESVIHFSGDCELQPLCEGADQCYVTGTVTVKNLVGGAANILVDTPSGGEEELGDGDSVNMQLISLHTTKECGESFILNINNAATGAFIGEVRYNCNDCPTVE